MLGGAEGEVVDGRPEESGMLTGLVEEVAVLVALL